MEFLVAVSSVVPSAPPPRVRWRCAVAARCRAGRRAGAAPPPHAPHARTGMAGTGVLQGEYEVEDAAPRAEREGVRTEAGLVRSTKRRNSSKISEGLRSKDIPTRVVLE